MIESFYPLKLFSSPESHTLGVQCGQVRPLGRPAHIRLCPTLGGGGRRGERERENVGGGSRRQEGGGRTEGGDVGGRSRKENRGGGER